jgi:glycosyltransferase involved in cell wall biosynthesis
MVESGSKKVAFISTYTPRICGIATFTADLIENTSNASQGNFEPLIVAMRNDAQLEYKDPVKFEIRENVKKDYLSAADYINFSHVDMVSVQHEFGLFGGKAGSYLSLLLNRLNVPVITTLHTVLDDPEPEYRQSMLDLCNISHKVITMNHRGIEMLENIYGVDSNKIELIAHGIPDLPFVDSNYYKHKFGMEGRKTIMTFGLLSQNKGIELMLEAMPEIIKADPSVVYVVLGMTHPLVLKNEGESYRFSLQRKVKELGIEKHVLFHNRFVGDQELSNFLCATDIYVTPYMNREQLTSGTLSFAVGTGKAVVSTPYWAAEELLADGRGELVPFGKPNALAEKIVKLIKDEKYFYNLRQKAYDYGRLRTWDKIGQQYWTLFNSEKIPFRINQNNQPVTSGTVDIELPELSLQHLEKLTDDTGLCQHAKFTIPNRNYGYCTDDNARAVILMIKYYAQFAQPDTFDLLDNYLSFIMYSQTNDGHIRNFMNYERQWMLNEPQSDAIGRFIWALGAVMDASPKPNYISIVKDYFDRSAVHIPELSPRNTAYAILGMSEYLKQFPGASDIKRKMINASDKLIKLFKKSNKDWRWFEDSLSYDNAILCNALFEAALTFGDKYLNTAEQSCKFLIDKTYTGSHFSFVGCKGWYPKGGKKANFDQQPVEAAGTVLMLKKAYQATRNKQYLKLQRKAFDWFLGENDLHIPLYDFKTKGCYDALTSSGINLNQGAESTLSFLLALLEMIESYSLMDRISGTAAGETEQDLKKSKMKRISKPATIKSIRIDNKRSEKKARKSS